MSELLGASIVENTGLVEHRRCEVLIGFLRFGEHFASFYWFCIKGSIRSEVSVGHRRWAYLIKTGHISMKLPRVSSDIS